MNNQQNKIKQILDKAVEDQRKINQVKENIEKDMQQKETLDFFKSMGIEYIF